MMLRAVIALSLFVPGALIAGIPSTACGWLLLGGWLCACAAISCKHEWRHRLWAMSVVSTIAALAGCLRDANYRSVHMARVVAIESRPHAPAASSPSAVLEQVPAVSAAVADEEALALIGARLVVAGRRIPAPESRTLVAVMQDGYRRMKRQDGHVPTPMTGWMSGGVPDTVVIAPTGSAPPLNAVVFLHGWGGSWVLPCWQIAQAARQAGAMTVCPATRFEGDWWSAQGERTARETIAAVRAQGVKRVVLVGLSNGGAGASRIAPRLRGELDGLVLISGVAGEARASGLPTLVLHGSHDNMMPASLARQYAARTGARYQAFDGTHFALLERHAEMTQALAEFLRRRFE